MEEGIQSVTLRSYFSAIKHTLKTDGYAWDDNKVWLNALANACKLKNDKVRM